METTTALILSTVTLNDPLMLVTTVAPRPVPIDHPYIVFAREVYVWLVPVMVTVLLVSYWEFLKVK
jgi:hypothetical protein